MIIQLLSANNKCFIHFICIFIFTYTIYKKKKNKNCDLSVCRFYFIAVEVTEGTLNKIEMAFRAYDPCFGCATHTLPGKMPLTVNIRNSSGEIIDKISR